MQVRPTDYGSLDYLLFESSDNYDHAAWDSQRLEWIREAVDHHMRHSAAYGRLAVRRGFQLDDLRRSSDLASIPLISSGSFKRASVASSVDSPVRQCTSSGTRGTKSVVPRDGRTLERFVGTILHGLRYFVGERELRKAFVLGPPREDVGDLWFSYSLGLAEALGDTEYFVRDDTFEPERLYEQLESADRAVQPLIVTPPALLLAFLNSLERRDASVDLSGMDPFIITAGGWKRSESESVDRSGLTEQASRLLGVPGDHFRDVFNMVELNTLIFECSFGQKHVPPWLSVDARNPRNMEVCGDGDVGLLAYLDPTPLSYPGFILSDDLGSVSNRACRCGITGPVLQLERRLASIEERGCGLKMNRYASPEPE